VPSSSKDSRKGKKLSGRAPDRKEKKRKTGHPPLLPGEGVASGGMCRTKRTHGESQGEKEERGPVRGGRGKGEKEFAAQKSAKRKAAAMDEIPKGRSPQPGRDKKGGKETSLSKQNGGREVHLAREGKVRASTPRRSRPIGEGKGATKTSWEKKKTPVLCQEKKGRTGLGFANVTREKEGGQFHPNARHKVLRPGKKGKGSTGG